MKMLAGEAAVPAGKRIGAADLSVGYFAQAQQEQLRPDCDGFWHLRNLGGPDFATGDEVIVSHDRHLIKTVADSLWLVADGRAKAFDGDLDDYQQWLKSRGRTGPAAAKTATSAPKAAPRARSRVGALRREIEQRIAAIAAERARIEAELCIDPTHAGLQARYADLARDDSSMEARWMEVGTAIEAAEAQVDYPDGA